MKRRRRKRSRWKKMKEDQQQLWLQHLQQNKTTVQTTSVVEAASVSPAPGQENTLAAAALDGEDATVNKVQIVALLGCSQKFPTEFFYKSVKRLFSK
jgi:hypothetical protein